VTHATPAGFVVNHANRNAEDEIAVQYLERKPDLMLGGGERHFVAHERDDGRYVTSEFELEGYHTLTHRSQLADLANVDAPILGTFSRSHMPYALERMYDETLAEAVPSLDDMAVAALRWHLNRPQPFLLQIEGARVDHAGHINDPGSILFEQLEFDRTIDALLDELDGRNDILFILTTDHGTAGPNVNGVGSNYNDTNRGVLSLNSFRRPFDHLVEDLKTSASREHEALIYEATGFELDARGRRVLMESMFQAETESPWNRNKLIGQGLGRALERQTAVGFTTIHHTGELVDFAALGPNAERIPHTFDNTDVHRWLTELITA